MDEKIKLTDQDNNSGTVASYVPFYTDDNITLFNDDYRNIIDSFPPFNFIITDPPYGVNKAKWDLKNDWEILLAGFGAGVSKMLAEDGVLIIFTSTRYLAKTIDWIKLPYRWQFIWYCSNNMIPGDIGFAKYTSALIFSNKKSVHVNAQDLREYPAGTTELKSSFHPTPKPIDIIGYLIERFTKEGDRILDPFCGSGTALLASKKLGREAVGIEISQEYCEGIIKRLSQTEMFV
ncbi:MAG: site-specific DNA-methyltransferase [Bacteroidota bacterium]